MVLTMALVPLPLPMSPMPLPLKAAAGRSLYSRRNQVWRIIRRLVDAGIDADVACDRFYQAYGHTKGVNAIIQCIYDDRRLGRGVHPNLRV
jgi:hypothetical protein